MIVESFLIMNGMFADLPSWTKLLASFKKELAYLHMILRIDSFVRLVA
jgi:hypothetical protein